MNILFRNPKKTFGIFFFINIAVWLLLIYVVISVLSFLLNNPQAVGEFFGKIVHGFNTAK